jgi:hypothetical protein
MKKGWKSFLAACSIVLVTLGCSKVESNGSVSVKLTATDASGYQKVKVEILGVDVKMAGTTNADRGWTALEPRPGIYDLVNLESDQGIVIADRSNLPAGMINQVRVRLGIKNSVMVNGNSFPLNLPDGSDRSVVIDLKTQIDAAKLTEILLDADIGKSIVRHDNGDFVLVPFIKVRSIQLISYP